MSTDTYKKEVGMMNLENLIAEREGDIDAELSIDPGELLARYEDLYTGAVNDVLREFCLLDQALPGHILPLREYQTVAGFAFTVKSAPNVKITGEMEFRVQMLDELKSDSFVVWDTSGDEKATLWGGVMTATAKGLGVRRPASTVAFVIPTRFWRRISLSSTNTAYRTAAWDGA